MTDLVQLLTAGLSLGAAYALIALGFAVIYRSSQVFNFAHGELVSVGAFTMTSMVALGLPWALALVAAMAITGGVAAGVERAVIRPMIGRPVFVTIILTIFIGYLLRAGVLIVWGADMRGMPTAWDPMATIDLAGAQVLLSSIGSMLAGGLALGAFFLLYRYSKLGVGMRATSHDQEVALALGIPVGRIFGATWFIAGTYAALAGVFLSMFPNSLDPNLGFVALKAFPAVIVGGLTSPVGTVIAGFLLGLLEVLAQAYLEPRLGSFGHSIHTVFPYIVMILFLMFRPYGLFGSRDVERL
jgi:branched-chain amino acid transport system permease protein